MTMLSLTLTKYEAAINGLHDEVQFTLHMQDEILRLFPPVYVVHSGITRLVSSPNILDKPNKPIKTKVSIEPSMFLETDVLKFKDIILRWVLDLLKQQAEQTLEVSLETGEAVGHSFNFDLRNRNYWDAYIELLEKAPYQPLGYKPLDPEIEKRVKEIPQTPEQLQRIERIQQAKREEFLRTRRTRRLS